MVIEFIKAIIGENRIIGAKSLSPVFSWVDAAYAVNPGMKIQAGRAMSMGIGVIHGKYSKQKLNVKRSVEAELVGVSDHLPYNIWLLYFMHDQGHAVENNTLCQDNQITMLMLKNGRNSCTGNSKYVNIGCFFVKNRIDIRK